MFWISILSGIIGSIVAIIFYNIFNSIRSSIFYSKYKGTYEIYTKRDEIKVPDKLIKITEVNGSAFTVKYENEDHEKSDAKGKIQMNEKMPSLGIGHYYHEKSNDGWGNWTIHIFSDFEIFVDNQYQTMGASHSNAYIWRKICK